MRLVHSMIQNSNYICIRNGILGVCQAGTIQLVASQSEGTGLVQVCLDGSWTYVCRSGWSNADAEVACRQLGYSFYRKFYRK